MQPEQPAPQSQQPTQPAQRQDEKTEAQKELEAEMMEQANQFGRNNRLGGVGAGFIVAGVLEYLPSIGNHKDSITISLFAGGIVMFAVYLIMEFLRKKKR